MIAKTFKIGIIGIVWSYLFFYYANILFLYFWGFDLFSPAGWQKIAAFWNHGGIICEGKDYAFLFTILLLPFVWIIGWRWLCRIRLSKIITWPFEAYNRHIIKKYGSQAGKRFVLKNMGQSTKIEEDIKIATNAVKPNPEQDADKIREAVKNKLSKAQPKK